MNLLESQWFFQMVERGGKTPAEKLVAIFGITETWISAPGIRDLFLQAYPEQASSLHAFGELKQFLSGLAASAKFEKPEVLASHLIILLQGAIVEELRNPDTRALAEAAKAAQAVVARSSAPGKRKVYMRLSAAGLAASLLVAVAVWHSMERPASAAYTYTYTPTSLISAQAAASPFTGASPSEMEAVLALHEEIEKGACPAPQFLAMPQGQVTAYMNAINFRTPENPAMDRENLRAFLTWFNSARASECYYRPANGHTTVAWVPRQAGVR